MCKSLGRYPNRDTRGDRAVIAVRSEMKRRGEGGCISIVRWLSRLTRIVRITRVVKS